MPKGISEIQKKELFKFLNNHSELINGKFDRKFTIEQGQALWIEISKTLNHLNGDKKHWKLWRKTWQDMRTRTKGKTWVDGTECFEKLNKTEEEVLRLSDPELYLLYKKQHTRDLDDEEDQLFLAPKPKRKQSNRTKKVKSEYDYKSKLITIKKKPKFCITQKVVLNKSDEDLNLSEQSEPKEVADPEKLNIPNGIEIKSDVRIEFIDLKNQEAMVSNAAELNVPDNSIDVNLKEKECKDFVQSDSLVADSAVTAKPNLVKIPKNIIAAYRRKADGRLEMISSPIPKYKIIAEKRKSDYYEHDIEINEFLTLKKKPQGTIYESVSPNSLGRLEEMSYEISIPEIQPKFTILHEEILKPSKEKSLVDSTSAAIKPEYLYNVIVPNPIVRQSESCNFTEPEVLKKEPVNLSSTFMNDPMDLTNAQKKTNKNNMSNSNESKQLVQISNMSYSNELKQFVQIPDLINSKEPKQCCKIPDLLNSNESKQSVQIPDLLNSNKLKQCVQIPDLSNSNELKQLVQIPDLSNSNEPQQLVQTPDFSNYKVPKQLVQIPDLSTSNIPIIDEKDISSNCFLNGVLNTEIQVSLVKKKGTTKTKPIEINNTNDKDTPVQSDNRTKFKEDYYSSKLKLLERGVVAQEEHNAIRKKQLSYQIKMLAVLQQINFNLKDKTR